MSDRASADSSINARTSNDADNRAVASHRFHPDREAALGEAHARPPLNLAPGECVHHFASLCSSGDGMQILADFVGADFNQKLRYAAGELDGFAVKIERHTEFISCTIVTPRAVPAPSMLELLNRLTSGADTQLLVAARVELAPDTKTMLKCIPFGKRMYGGKFYGGVDVRTTLSPDDDGVVTFALNASKQSPVDLGRRVQRLLEIETYRTLCLIGLSLARRSTYVVEEIEQELSTITTQLAGAEVEMDTIAEDVFNRLVELSARADSLQSQTRFRFSASKAYFDLVQQRLETIREEKVGDIQRLTSFIQVRLEPATSTIESVAKRQHVLSEDLSRALALLRTQIDLALNKANQESLRSLDKRHRQQLLISQTVEGLSVIAITYYAIGLVGYIFKAMRKAGQLPVSAEMATALSVPIVLLATLWGMHRLRKRWHK